MNLWLIASQLKTGLSRRLLSLPVSMIGVLSFCPLQTVMMTMTIAGEIVAMIVVQDIDLEIENKYIVFYVSMQNFYFPLILNFFIFP